MISLLRCIQRPEYVFRPRQILARLRRIGSPPKPIETIQLPWGSPVEARLDDQIGCYIIWHGIFDRIVPEAIARLLDPAELAMDVGANLGQNASLMATASGPQGKVICFEPHPVLFPELARNRQLWDSDQLASIQLEQVALGEKDGEAFLEEGGNWESNRGVAGLNDSAEANGRRHKVQLKTLDDYLHDSAGVVKLDVEGGELRVLEGARESLKNRRIRDLIFEDFAPQPSDLTRTLADSGFSLFALDPLWLGPKLVPLDKRWEPRPHCSYNFLATLDPERARERFRRSGWLCLKSNGYWRRKMGLVG